MQTETVIDEIRLASGQVLAVCNRTKVYFGDYHHIKLEVRGEISSPDSSKTAVYCRTLEKMAVPTVDIDSAIQALLADFKNSSLAYLNSPEFADKFILASTSRKKPFLNRYYGSKPGA